MRLAGFVNVLFATLGSCEVVPTFVRFSECALLCLEGAFLCLGDAFLCLAVDFVRLWLAFL